MVQLRSFRSIEPQAATAAAASENAPPTAATGDEPGADKAPGAGVSASAVARSVPSSGSSSPSTPLRRPLGNRSTNERDGDNDDDDDGAGGGGNLTSSDTRSSVGSRTSAQGVAGATGEARQAAAPRKRPSRRPLQEPLAQVVALSGVAAHQAAHDHDQNDDGDVDGSVSASELTTLSSSEEYQLARVEMGHEEEEEEAAAAAGDESERDGRVAGAASAQSAGVTKIQVGGPGGAALAANQARRKAAEEKRRGSAASAAAVVAAAAAATTTTTTAATTTTKTAARAGGMQAQRGHKQLGSQTPGAQHKFGRAQLARSHTSPSPLDQMAAAAAAAATTTATGAASPRGLERGKFSGPAQSPALSAAARPLARLAPDNASQLSFGAQAKYAGSKHFEIRWQHVRLFARPKSRLPAFVTDNPLYRSLVGGAGQGLDEDALYGSLGAEVGGGLYGGHAPLKPPYSPPLNYHKIPPTIDEHAEMKCPQSAPPAPAPSAPFNSSQSQQQQQPQQQPQNQEQQKQQQQQQQPQPQLEHAADISSKGSLGQPPASLPGGQRVILNSISGQVFSGQMTAVLGPSGVGKTSLLNSLTGRNTLDGTGRVSLIGAQECKRLSVVTVPQVDVLPGKLTTLEDLQFTSRLKNPQARFDHARNIERLVRHLRMEKFLSTRIDKLSGGEARRLSIARELLSSPDIMILDEPTSGLDANTCKKIITALRDIVEHSDNILDKPMSIIITIHQPQAEVYELFHRVYVMAQGGRVVYEGSPQMLLPTLLEHSSLTRAVPQTELNENPAIVAIEVASGEFGDQVIEELAQHHELQVYEEFSTFGVGPAALGNFESPLATPRSLSRGAAPKISSPLRAERSALAHRKRLNSFDSSLGRPTPQLARRGPIGAGQLQLQLERNSSVTSLSFASTYDEYLPEVSSRLKVDKRLRRSVVIKSHFVSHTLTLIRRCWLLTRRDLFLMAIRVLGFLLVAAGTVQIFSEALDPHEHQCPQFESEIDDMAGYIGSVRERLAGLLDILRQANSVHMFFFHLLLCITMVTSALTGLVFPLQMRMFIREYKNGWYSPASFIMSQTVAELPADIVGPLVCLLITYPLCHQPDSLYHWRLVGYALVLIMTSIICKSQAQIVGAFLMDSVENSVFISCVCVVGPALFSGIPLRVREMSAPLQWASYGSFLRYAFESLMELRYGYGMCPCDPELVDGPLRASARAIPPHLETLATGLLELSTGPNNASASATVAAAAAAAAVPASVGPAAEQENLFIKFLKLTTDASNLFQDPGEIEHCSSYRSLYLIGMGISPNMLAFWAVVMVCVFVLSRFLTYFAVKTVIKLRRS